jgi:hypothetical protein
MSQFEKSSLMLEIALKKLLPARRSTGEVPSTPVLASAPPLFSARRTLSTQPKGAAAGGEASILNRGITWADTVDLSDTTW